MKWILFLLNAAMLLAACSKNVGNEPVDVPIPETAAATIPPTIVPPTEMHSPILEAGQWAYVFYHEGLEQVVLVNGGPEWGKPADEPLELWGWDGTQWSLIATDGDGPTWRNWPAIAFDTTRDVLVIHGGLQPGTNFNETWEWDGQIWTRYTNTGPGAHEGALMVYDPARASMILFGGSTPDLEIHGDTWEWDGQRWTQASETGPARRFPAGSTIPRAKRC